MYFTCGYRHCIRTSAGPFFGTIHVYRAPTVSVSPQKKARPRGTDGIRPGEGTFGPNDTNTTRGRSVRSLISKAAPWGKRSILQVSSRVGCSYGSTLSWRVQI